MITNFKLYFDPLKMVKLLLMSIFLMSIGIYCLKSDITIMSIIGILETVLGIAVLFIALKNLFDKNPQIIMNMNGLIDNRILKNTILWNQIEKIELTTINNQNFLKLIVSENFDNKNFKWLFLKTSKEKLNQKPKNVLINLDHLKINNDNLNQYLSNKDSSFIQKNLDKQLTGLGSVIKKVFY